MRAALPPANVPFFDASGIINPDWYMALNAILNRTGGTSEDLVQQSLRASGTGIVVSLDPANGGTVTRTLAAGTGLGVTNGSGVSGSPTYSLSNTAVTAASYGDATHVPALTVNAQGQLTSVIATAIAFPVTSVFGRTGAIVAAANDYSFSQISGSLAASQMPTAINPASIGATTPGTGAFTTISATSTITPAQTSGIVGTTTNNNANAGSVGEYISSTVLAASAVALTSNTAANITSISLTAGDWTVSGAVHYTGSNSVSVSFQDGWGSTTTATVPAAPNNGMYFSSSATNPLQGWIAGSVGQMRLSLASPATVYLSTRAIFSGGTLSALGFIGARRVR